MTEVITFSDTSIKVANGIHDHTNSSGTAGYYITAGGDGSWSWQQPELTITDFSGTQTGNIIIGHEAANYGNTESDNVIIGVQAAYNAPDASGAHAHIAIGAFQQYLGGYESYSIAIGHGCGYQYQGANSITIGNYSGRYSLKDNSIAIGYYAGYDNSGTSETVYLGYQAGRYGSGSKSIIIGGNSYASSTSASDEIIIGHTVTGKGSNTIILGQENIDSLLYTGRGKIGMIGWSNHFALSHVDCGTQGDFAFLQRGSDGYTVTNCSLNSYLGVGVGNSYKLLVQDGSITVTGDLTANNGDIKLDQLNITDIIDTILTPGLNGRKYSNWHNNNIPGFFYGTSSTAPTHSTGIIEEHKYSYIDVGDLGDYYSYYWQGFFIPTQTTTHYFEIHSDDTAWLYVNGSQLLYNYTSQTTQSSMSMTAGTPYYIEIFHGEFSSSGYMRFRWVPSGGSWSTNLLTHFKS